MNAGRLRHRVTIQERSLVADGLGGQTETWSDSATVWASIEPVKGSSDYRAQQIQEGITHRVTMRYRSGVTTQQRLKFGTRIFNTKAVINPEERNERLVLEVGEAL